MQPISNRIWIEVETTHNNKAMIGDKEIYLDTSYEHEFHARQYGIVYAVSESIKDIKKGDKIYFHHFVIRKENKVNFVEDKMVFQTTKPFVYAIVRDGKLKMLDNWVFVEQVLEDESKCKTDSGIWIKPDQEDEELHGILRYSNNELIEQGANINDRIIFSKDSEYVMDIEGEDLMRMRNEDVLAIYNG